MDIIYKEDSYKIIGACIEVYNNLGNGFLEAVYQEALEIEFELRNIPYVREKPFEIIYKDRILSKKYYADFVVYDKIIIETKAIRQFTNADTSQGLNYLNASKLKLCILVNFGSDELTWERLVR